MRNPTKGMKYVDLSQTVLKPQQAVHICCSLLMLMNPFMPSMVGIAVTSLSTKLSLNGNCMLVRYLDKANLGYGVGGTLFQTVFRSQQVVQCSSGKTETSTMMGV